MRWAVLSFRGWMWLVPAAAVAMTAASPAVAQDARARARAQFERGVAAFEAGRYEEALAAFQEAYRLKPHPSVRLNMAACYEELGRPLEALVHYRAFLAESPDAPRDRVREVKAAIRKAERSVARLELDVVPDGARVTIDEAESRRAPVLDPILLNPGEHVVRVELAGYATAERRITLRKGERKRVEVRLRTGGGGAERAAGGERAEPELASTSEAAGELDAPTAEGGGEEGPGQEVLDEEASSDGWQLRITDRVMYAGIATGAAALIWVGTGIGALGADATHDEQLARANDPRLPRSARFAAGEEARSAANTANTLAAVSDVFLVLTVAGLAVTGWFAWEDGAREEDEEADLAVGVAPGGGGGVVTLGGRF